MKIILGLALTVLLLINTGSALADHIQAPNLPIGETAFKIQRFRESCGELIVYSYNQKGFLAIYTLNNKWLAVILYDGDGFPKESWLIRNLDGHINEHANNPVEILYKYASVCDIVTKGGE